MEARHRIMVGRHVSPRSQRFAERLERVGPEVVVVQYSIGNPLAFSATAMIRSTTPGRAMTSCVNASSHRNSVKVSEEVGVVHYRDGNALARRAGGSAGCSSGQPSVNAIGLGTKNL
jgi:hypothetical protein